MSNEIVPSSGGAIVPGGASGTLVVPEPVGDVSLDRGVPSQGAGASGPIEPFFVDQARRAATALSPIIGVRSLDQRQMGAIATWIRQENQRRNAERLERDELERAETEGDLGWGDSHAGNVQAIMELLIDVCGTKEAADRVTNSRDLTGRAFGNDASLLKALVAFARKFRELERAAPKGGQRGADPPADLIAISSARLREIERWMGANDPRYWRDDQVQAEYRALLDKGVTNDRHSTVVDADLERRISEIERWMGARKGSADYARYWGDASLQLEYGQLIGRRNRGQ